MIRFLLRRRLTVLLAVAFATWGCDDMLDGLCECDCEDEDEGLWGEDTGHTDNTGNSQADEIIGDANVQKAIRDSNFPIHSGTNPPNLEGSYHPVTGSIQKSFGARPVGSQIDSPGTCLYDQTPSGSLSYQEYGVDQAAGSYITGSGDNYTVYLASEGGAYLFSGTKSGNNLTNVVGLVVYTGAAGNMAGAWEYSVTNWTWESSSCRDTTGYDYNLSPEVSPLIILP